MLSDPTLLIVALIVVTLGAALQSLAGFGLAVIAAPVLVLIEPDFLPAPLLALGCLLSLLNTCRYRQQLTLGPARTALIGRVFGSGVGILLLSLLPAEFFALSFSLFIMLSVLLTYRTYSVAYSPQTLLVAGFFSGVMATTTAIGGPPIALAYQNTSLSETRAGLGLFFLFATLISLVLLLVSGNISPAQVQLTLPLLPAVIAGFFLSKYVEQHFQPQYLKPVIALLSLSASAIILIKTIAQ